MKQHKPIIIISFLLLITILFPQFVIGQQKEITLNTSISNTQTVTYTARDAIYLQPGFSYSGENPHTFTAKIDENILLSTEYLASAPSASNRTLDLSKSVGSTAGSATVGLTGAATYQIPITVAPGIGGMQPNISLVYNSQGGNGPVGWGFNIAGLSAITRSPKTIYADGEASGLKNSSADKYTLDGNRLFAVSGTYASDGTEYATETANFSRIYSRGNYGDNGPDWFEVTGKDGIIYKYGSASGKITYSDDTGKQSVQYWLLDYVENPATGQTMVYEYETSNLCAYIKRIRYGDNTVEFFYETRTDVVPIHFDRVNGQMNRILQKITTRCAESVLRQYQLEYTKDIYSRLAKITENNGNGESFNPTVFEWGSSPVNSSMNTSDVSVQKYSGDDFSEMYFLSEDINEDGLSDLIGIYPTRVKIPQAGSRDSNGNPTMRETDGVKIRAYIASKNENNGKINFTPKDSLVFEDSFIRSRQYNHFGDYRYAKIDSTKGVFYANYYYDIKDNEANPKGISFKMLTPLKIPGNVIFNRALTVDSPDFPEYVLADIDNNGNDELILIEKGVKENDYYPGCIVNFKLVETYDTRTDRETGQKIIYPYIGVNHFENEFNFQLSAKPERIIPADFDGDGLQDIMVVTKKGYTIFWNQGGGSLSANFSNRSNRHTTTNSLFNSEYSRYEIGDFNGDGLPDFILNEHGNNKWYLAINDGKKSFIKTELSNFTGYNLIEEDFTDKNDDKDRCIVVDFDGDGKSDVIISDSKYSLFPFSRFQSHSVYWFRSNGNGFDLVKQARYDKEDALNKYFTVGDFNGDGNQELMFYGYDCFENDIAATGKTQKWRIYEKTGFTEQAGKITTISDGLNNKSQFEYTPLTNKKVYTKQNTAVFPVMDIQAPLYVVKQATDNVGSNTQNTTVFTYKGAKVHTEGKGFIGFSEASTSNSVLDRKTTAKYDYHKSYFYPYMTEQKATTTSGDPISTTSYVNSVRGLGGLRIFPYVSEVIEENHLNDIRISKKNEVNSNGNITKETTTYGSDATLVTDYTYIHKGGNGVTPNRVSSVTTTKTYTGQPAFTTKQEFEYDAKGILTIQTDLAHTGNNKLITEYLKPNALGLAQEVKKKAGDLPALSTKYEYDSKGRITKVTDALNLSSTSVYDRMGNLSSATDALGNTVSYGYNRWGQLIQTTYPTGSVEAKSLQWAASDGNRATDAIYKTTASVTGKPDATVFYDALGRNLRSVTQNISGQNVYINKFYNVKGQLRLTSYPSFEKNNGFGTAYFYDKYGRIQNERPHDHTINISYAYNKRTTTITKNLQVSIDPSDDPTIKRKSVKTINALGDLISSEDDAGNKVTYTYHSSGQPLEISAAGVVTKMEYDNCGRQNKIIDPSAGTKTYKYDAAGNVIEEIDAENRKISMVYDQYSRLEKKIHPEFTVNYTYDKYSTLTSESTTNGNPTAYEYDKLGRILMQKEITSGGKSLTKTYSYSRDDLSSVTYNSQSEQIATENYVYKNGYLHQVKLNNGTVIWQLDSENAEGKPTRVTTGNLTREYTYDYYKFPEYRTVRNTSGYIQYAKYRFSLLDGNLTGRADYSRNLFETFGYDNLNRLVSCTEESPPDKIVVFSQPAPIEEMVTVQSDATLPVSQAMLMAAPPGFGPITSTISYDNLGNIENKSNIGTFVYRTEGKPYAVSGATPMTNAIPLREQTATYTSFMRPSSITEGSVSSGGDIYYATFVYNGAGERVRMNVTKNGNTYLTRHYVSGRYEYENTPTTTKERLYLAGDAYSAPAVYVKQNNGNWQIYYICRDHLGSITQITDSNGSLVHEQSYDAWGRLRDPSSQTAYSPGSEPELFLGRGYTGHEHLSMFGLINMNARLYDPAVGRFLSPDPYVQMPDLVQNYNRYSYCLNNPLLYSDPSGEFPWILALFALQNGLMQGAMADMNGGNFWAGFAKGAAISTASSLLTAGVGDVLGHTVGNFGTELVRAGAHGMIGGGVNAIQGGDFLQGFGTGFASSFAGSGMMALGMPADILPLATGIVGGSSSWLLGGDPINGFFQGYGIGALNHTGGRGTFEDPYQLEEVTVATRAPMYIERNGIIYARGLNSTFYGTVVGERGLNNVYPEFDIMMLGRGIFNSVRGLFTNTAPKVGTQVGKEAITVTPEGVALPKGAKIPSELVKNPYYKGSSYGSFENGKFIERLRIDQATPPGFKGPNQSHFHLNNGGHIFDSNKWPWWW